MFDEGIFKAPQITVLTNVINILLKEGNKIQAHHLEPQLMNLSIYYFVNPKYLDLIGQGSKLLTKTFISIHFEL